MDSKEAFDKMYEDINSAHRPFEREDWYREDWYREGIKAAQEKIVKEYFENQYIHSSTKIADPD